MAMLIAGSDVSGIEKISEHRVIAIIFGEKENLKALHREIGVPYIHMSKINDKKKNKVIQRLEFDEITHFGFSFQVDKMRIVHEIHNHKKRLDKYEDIGSIYRFFDQELLKKVQPILEPKVMVFKKHFNELCLEVDEDMMHTSRNWGLTNHIGNGIAQQLSDATAYCHNNEIDIPGLKTFDFSQDLEKIMK